MKNFMICSLALLLLLAVVSLAAPMKLDGSAGKAILEGLADDESRQSEAVNQTANQTMNQTVMMNKTENQTGNKTAEGLWSWGGVPSGHTLNESSGKLELVPTGESDWLTAL